MTEKVATIFGMIFMGVIVVCLVWTVLSYILEASIPKNKIEKHFKNFKK